MYKFVNIHTHKESELGISIFNAPLLEAWSSYKYLSFGLHPWEIEKVPCEEYYSLIRKICKRELLVAIGEIGLDRAISTPLEIQKEVFIRQLEIAEEYKLPVIIHSVRTNSDLLQIKRKQKKFD